MDSPFDVHPGLRDALPMAETWHRHHVHPWVITGIELARLSNSDDQSSQIHHYKRKDPKSAGSL